MKFKPLFAEKRDISKSWGKQSVFGHSSLMLECPYCHNAVLVVIWSWYGKGKKCWDCWQDFKRKGILSPYGAFRYDLLPPLDHKRN